MKFANFLGMRVLFLIVFCFLSMGWSEIGTHGHLGVGEIYSAHTLSHMQAQLGFSNRLYASNKIFEGQRFSYKGTNYPVDDFVALSSYFTAVLGLGHNFETSLTVPYYYDYMSFDRFETSGIGDINVKMKVRLSRQRDTGPFEMSLIAAGYGGTASSEEGLVPRDLVYYNEDQKLSPFGRQQIYFSTTAAATLDLFATPLNFPLEWHLNSGYTFPVDNFPGVIHLGTAIQYRPSKSWLLSSDLLHKSRENRFNTPDQFETEYTVWGASASFITYQDISITFGASRDLFQSGFETIRDGSTEFAVHPERDWTGRFSLQGKFFLTPQDLDEDGIIDKLDQCVSEREDKDGFEDADGCPEADNDLDGVLDIDDECALVPEDRDGFQDKDGCPEFDNDQDGIPDVRDRCPSDAEDKDGFEDADGCPDIDNDQDNVPDSLDQCPSQAEDRDQFEDADGCPDLDNDQDRIIDSKDKCPNVAETYNNIDDFDGCPEVQSGPVKNSGGLKSKTLKDVRFKLGTSSFTFDSFDALDILAQKMLRQPKYAFEIQVHTDNTMNKNKSLTLTKQQGLAIRSYLMSRGVPGFNLTVTPMGSQAPIATNSTVRGRAKNRRVLIIPKALR